MSNIPPQIKSLDFEVSENHLLASIRDEHIATAEAWPALPSPSSVSIFAKPQQHPQTPVELDGTELIELPVLQTMLISPAALLRQRREDRKKEQRRYGVVYPDPRGDIQRRHSERISPDRPGTLEVEPMVRRPSSAAGRPVPNFQVKRKSVPACPTAFQIEGSPVRTHRKSIDHVVLSAGMKEKEQVVVELERKMSCHGIVYTVDKEGKEKAVMGYGFYDP